MAIDSNELLDQASAGIGRRRGERLFLWGRLRGADCGDAGVAGFCGVVDALD